MPYFFVFISDHLNVFLRGASYTVTLSFVSIILGAGLGLILCFGLVSKNTIIQKISACYRSIFRGTPLLIQLLIIFYFLPFIGFDVPPVVAAILALTLNTAAFQAEIYRGGLLTIEKGQIETARILGLGKLSIRIRILIPQIFRLVLPSLVNEAISILKNSSLISVIAVTELMRVSQQIVSTTYRPFEVYIFAAILYLIMTATLAGCSILCEKRLKRAYKTA